ncbi:MAG: ABC transporter substrate-binding protein [Bacteroidota bacterium]
MRTKQHTSYLFPSLSTILLLFLITSCSEPTEIIFTHGPDDTGTLQQLIDEFNAQHTSDIHVTLQEGARLSNDYYRELEKEFSSGTSDIDIISTDVVWTSTLAEQGWVKDISQQFFTDYRAEDFVSAALNSVSYRNTVWGVPWYTDLGILYYRKDLLHKYGYDHPPTTWAQVHEIAKKIQDDSFIEYGYLFQGGNYEGGVANACEFIWNAGGQIMLGDLSIAGDDPHVPLLTINSEEAIKGLEEALTLVANGIAPAEVYTHKEAESLAAFKNGDALFMRSWPGVYTQILSADSPITADALGVAALPVSQNGSASYSCLGGWNLMLSASSSAEEQEAAWTFIQFLTAEDQQRTLAEQGGNLPAIRSLYQDEELVTAVPALGLAMRVLPNARLRPVTPFYMEFAPDIAWAFSELMQGNLTSIAAVESMEGLFQNAMVARDN